MQAILELLGGDPEPKPDSSPLGAEPVLCPVLARFPLGNRPLHIGRAPDNDVVLTDETVSAYHISLWWKGDEVWVRDRRSRNGTWLSGQAVKPESALPPGAILRVGLGTWMRLRVEESPVPAPVQPLLLEMLQGGLQIPLAETPIALGRGSGADVLVDLPDDEVVLVHQEGPLAVFWTEREGRTELPVEGTITLGNWSFRLLWAAGPPVATIGQGDAHTLLRLQIRVHESSGVEAVVQAAQGGEACRIEAENRAVLLYILARRARDDRAKGLGPDEAGWCSDEEVVLGVWGREGARMEANNLHVLLHRLRRELAASGLKTPLIEKRRRAIRCCAAEIIIHELPRTRGV